MKPVRQLSWIDKSSWPDGPWKQEPDKIEWRDEATGLPCMIRRNERDGILCGYVGVPEGHPSFGQSYESIDVDVHGGLTFTNYCDEHNKEQGICHLPLPGEPDRVFWLGFDCHHYLDYAPGIPPRYRYPFEDKELEYRDVTYVELECTNLAAQLKAMA